MDGKIVLVTGSTGGIGLAAATALARLDAAVVINGRDPATANAVAARIRAATGNHKVSALAADLSSRAGVHRLAREFTAIHPRLDVLVNNVGAIHDTRRVTADGYEYTFALNHLAPFLLTGILLDPLRRVDGRIITVTSLLHAVGRIDFADLHRERRYSGLAAYCQSKLANVLFTLELARRLSGVTANAVHPGIARTHLLREDGPRTLRMIESAIRPLLSTPDRAGAGIVRLATAPDLHGKTGGYYGPYPRRPSRTAHDPTLASRLWQLSEELTDFHYPT